MILAGGLAFWNYKTEAEAAARARAVADEFESMVDMPSGDRSWAVPSPEDYLERVIKINDESYVSEIVIPKLDLTLPVHAEWSEALSKTAPCRYSGGIGTSDLIIAGHNYTTHFGRLDNLVIGDLIELIDCDGREFWYSVVKQETVDGHDIDGMQSGDWDLTLFTCTYDGTRRITLRCKYFV